MNNFDLASFTLGIVFIVSIGWAYIAWNSSTIEKLDSISETLELMRIECMP